MIRQLDPGTYPYLLEHVAVHMKEPGEGEEDEEGEFEFGLDLVLDGLERYERLTT